MAGRSVQAFDNSTGAVRDYVDGFLTETRNELFPSREACIIFIAGMTISNGSAKAKL